MAFDAFVKIEDIEGESTDDKHQGWIEVLSYNMGVSQRASSTASSAGGAGAQRADFAPFTFAKLLDKASPSLALACADGSHIDTITVEVCRAGTEKIKFMEYKLTDCIISSVTTSGTGGTLPGERVSIAFGKIQWACTQQKRQGGRAAGNVAAGWCLMKNCKM
jgi:type VI secretion system secreted protein Hcp